MECKGKVNFIIPKNYLRYFVKNLPPGSLLLKLPVGVCKNTKITLKQSLISTCNETYCYNMANISVIPSQCMAIANKDCYFALLQCC